MIPANVIALDGVDTTAGADLNMCVGGGAEERVEDGACGVGDGEEFAGLLALQQDTELCEEVDDLRDVESAEDVADGVTGGAGEGRLIDDVMGDVASAAAGDEDFRAEPACAVEDEDASVGVGAAGGDGGHESGSASADEGDVGVVIGGHRGRHSAGSREAFP